MRAAPFYLVTKLVLEQLVRLPLFSNGWRWRPLHLVEFEEGLAQCGGQNEAAAEECCFTGHFSEQSPDDHRRNDNLDLCDEADFRRGDEACGHGIQHAADGRCKQAHDHHDEHAIHVEVAYFDKGNGKQADKQTTCTHHQRSVELVIFTPDNEIQRDGQRCRQRDQIAGNAACGQRSADDDIHAGHGKKDGKEGLLLQAFLEEDPAEEGRKNGRYAHDKQNVGDGRFLHCKGEGCSANAHDGAGDKQHEAACLDDRKHVAFLDAGKHCHRDQRKNAEQERWRKAMQA